VKHPFLLPGFAQTQRCFVDSIGGIPESAPPWGFLLRNIERGMAGAFITKKNIHRLSVFRRKATQSGGCGVGLRRRLGSENRGYFSRKSV
ncbi:MAG: hypothetical protein JXQ72_08665, partial [Anaerolineae bacterium]|nr:hypothetical protein [Anaerolineae bacterium]